MTQSFLAAAGWAGATAIPLASDASTRRYTRLLRGSQSAVLMEAPIATAVDRASYDAFRHIGVHLRNHGFSAPEEYHADPGKGLILMEDLGDQTLSHLLRTDPDTARTAYFAVSTVLPRVVATAPKGLATPDAVAMADMVSLTFDQLPGSDSLRATLLAALVDALKTHAGGPPVLSLRDVHGDNLLWLPDRNGDARIGLLDFQDALMLPDGYDLASLLDDPRREVPEAWRATLTAHDPLRFATLSLQRNLRILGIFHSLSTQFGKPAYTGFLPRTRTLIARCMADLPPLRAPVAELLARTEHWSAP